MEKKRSKEEILKSARERIKNGEFLKALKEETKGVKLFIKFLHNKRTHARQTKRRDIPIGN
ncbi:MAG: hypothetical protein LiPW41_75 [Parcubacteria group bacterium LiPW_41]|nr:MAG: hypothetical protein LiPW41_75 [Parcubacteria group bacterium LiPW_41]